MKTISSSALKVAAAVAAAVCVSWTPAKAAEVTLSALSFLPNHTANGKPFADWVEKINKDAKGLIQIDQKAPGSMSPFTMGNAVKNGVVDLVHRRCDEAQPDDAAGTARQRHDRFHERAA